MTPDAPGRPTELLTAPLPVSLWLIWTLAVVVTAAWVAWPALQGPEPLDTLRLVIMSGLAGVAELLVITVIELHLAPWRFLD